MHSVSKSYSIRIVKGKLPKESFSTYIQPAFFDSDHTAETYYKLSHPSFIECVDRYTAHHELKVNKIGRANGKLFTFYYEPHDFPFYHIHNRSLIYICTKKDVVKDFLHNANLDKDWPAVPIDYAAMTPLLPPITGAWFCQLNLKYVKTAGYFGNHIDRSDQYKEAAERGQISVLYINIPWPPGGPEYKVGITSGGAIVILKNLELEEEEIKLVTHVYDTYILPTLATQKE